MAKWKQIKINKIPDVDKFVTEVANNITSTLKPAQDDLNQFVGTWKHKPKIRLDKKKKINSIEAFTGVISNWTKGSTPKPEDLLLFVTRGTDKRYVQLTHDFVPKTKKGVIRSGPGQGGVYRKSNVPYPGIEAREIEQTIKKLREAQIIRDMKKIVINAVYKSGGTKI